MTSREYNTVLPTVDQADDPGFWDKLRRGDYGLPKTFWLAWFIPIWLLGFAMEVASTAMFRLADTAAGETAAISAVLIQMGIFLTYFTIGSIWTLRAARRHPNAWALAAKVAIGLQAGAVVVGTAAIAVVLIVGIPLD